MTGGPSDDQTQRVALEAFRARQAGAPSPGELVAGQPARVERLDRPGAYVLVPVQDAAGLRGIVQLDAQELSVETYAEIRDPASPFLATEAEVLAAARSAFPDKRGWRTPFLGWQPCRESFDSLRPLWVVPHAEGQVYVTQSREVFEALTTGRGG